MSNACQYNLPEIPGGASAVTPWVIDEDNRVPPDGLKWSSMGFFVPEIGARVTTKAHNNQSGVVTGYFVEHGWLGLHVRLDETYVNGNGRGFDTVHVFGCDLV